MAGRRRLTGLTEVRREDEEAIPMSATMSGDRPGKTGMTTRTSKFLGDIILMSQSYTRLLLHTHELLQR